MMGLGYLRHFNSSEESARNYVSRSRRSNSQAAESHKIILSDTQVRFTNSRSEIEAAKAQGLEVVKV